MTIEYDAEQHKAQMRRMLDALTGNRVNRWGETIAIPADSEVLQHAVVLILRFLLEEENETAR